jgi:integral membrane protein (TIGR01906 family)
MNRTTVFRWLTLGFFTLALPLWLIVGSVRVVMNPFWLHFEYTRADFRADPYGMTMQDRLNYGHYGIDYLLNGEDIRFLANLRLPASLCVEGFVTGDSCPLFNAAALRHMEDVKIVTQAAYGTALVTLIIGLVLGFFVQRHIWLRGLWQGSLLTLALIAGIVILAIGAWDVFFDLFHGLFFEAGTWQFYYSDTLIRLYPEQFWFDSALVVGGLTSVGALVCGAWAWRQLRITTSAR